MTYYIYNYKNSPEDHYLATWEGDLKWVRYKDFHILIAPKSESITRPCIVGLVQAFIELSSHFTGAASYSYNVYMSTDGMDLPTKDPKDANDNRVLLNTLTFGKFKDKVSCNNPEFSTLEAALDEVLTFYLKNKDTATTTSNQKNTIDNRTDFNTLSGEWDLL